MVLAYFKDYRPVMTELKGLGKVIHGSASYFWNTPGHASINFAFLIGPDGEVGRQIQLLSTRQPGAQEFYDGVKLLGKSPLTYLALTAMTYYLVTKKE